MLISLVLVALFGGLIFGLLVLWRNYRVSNVPALFVVVPIAAFVWVAFAVVVNLIIYFVPPVMNRENICSSKTALGPSFS